MLSRASSRLVVALLPIVALPAVSWSQRSAGLELGLYGGYTRMDRSLVVADGVGGGARLGVPFGAGASGFGLEVEGSYSSLSRTYDGTQTTYSPARLRLLYRALFTERGGLELGVGGVRNAYQYVDASSSDYGLS